VLILALDTSGLTGSIALLDGPRLVRETALPGDRRSAQTLAPAIVELLGQAGVKTAQIRLVATTIGPGSFTGLRVGVTAAKTFAYAAGAEVLGISTLEAIAHGVPAAVLTTNAGEIHAVLDAQRRELFVGRFLCEAGAASGACLPQLARVETDPIVPIDAWLASLSLGTIVSGSGINKLMDGLPEGVIVAPPEQREPRASIVGRLAWRDYQGGRRDDLWKLAPRYLRASYAEEKASVKP
jgi:tRNA threonylcarbamoyladenosine biosynthesis protein TsaB